MMDALFYSVIVVISVLVVLCIVKIFTKEFFNKKENTFCIYTIIPVNGKEEIEYTVRSVLWSEKWGKYLGQYILLVVSSYDEETIKICEKLCEEYEPVSMCRPNQLEEFINNPEIFISDVFI